ncbi:MAG: ROK family protein [Planctomycetota bacterium]
MSRAALGLDIGGTAIKAVRIDPETGEVLKQLTEATPDTGEALIATARGMVEALGGGKVGVAGPGLADERNRWIAWMRGRMEMLEGLDWSAALGDLSGAGGGVPVINDAQAATFAEAWIGAAAGRQSAAMLTLGTGVGGALILDGRLVMGRFGRAGCFGHLTLDLDGTPDIVGTPGSLEDLVGNHTVEQRTGFASTRALAEAAAAGDAEAEKHWARTVYALACGVNTLINAVSPEAVIVGGGIAASGDTLFGPLRAAVAKLEWRPWGQADATPILPATLGPWAGAIGAAKFAASGGDLSGA